jgi:hypothetical protein
MTRLLIVEDQKRLLQSLRRGLEEEGYEVAVATTGEQGFYIAVRREKARIFRGCDSHPDNWSLHPVAIGAAAEVTKPSKPSRQRAASSARRAGRPQRK